jgi:hippurate hydrolase
MSFINPESQLHRDMIAWRHDLHRHPELGLQEQRTSAMVQAALRRFGVDEVITGLAGTGVVGAIQGRRPGRAIGLRADMDALPIREETGLPHASCIEGDMHACGHDGHTAMLLGAARYLAATRDFEGTVYAIFQPGEEGCGGAALMIRDGLFERCPMEAVHGLHNWPQLPLGCFGWRPGPITAGAAKLEIAISGRGCHAAFPHLGVDPIAVASHVVCGLQTIVSRMIDPVESGVVTIAQMTAGSACNVIPDTATMLGTLRWSRPSIGNLLETEVRRIATGIAESLGAAANVTIEPVMPATINDAALAAAAVAGEAGVQRLETPSMAGEDFAFMLDALPGNYILLGSGQSTTPVHGAKYDFNDDILPIGASYWVTLVELSLRPTTHGAHEHPIHGRRAEPVLWMR